MSFVHQLLMRVVDRVLTTIEHNWPFLLAAILIASAIQVFVGTDRLARLMRRSTPAAVVGAVGFGALTPFCSCGTTAVVLGSLASAVPWAPVVAFMASSPLTSPEEYVLSIGLFGVRFATTYFVAAIAVGIIAGASTWFLERAGLLKNQARVVPATTTAGSHGGASDCCFVASDGDETPVLVPLTIADAQLASGCCEAEPTASAKQSPRGAEYLRAVRANGQRLILLFLAFASLGYLLIELIPTSVLQEHLGQGNAVTAVPLAALLGIPMYLNTDANLPLVASLMKGGMGPGPALAFLITGAGTSVGAIAGMLVIARWRIVAIVVGTLFLTACLTGWLAPLWL